MKPADTSDARNITAPHFRRRAKAKTTEATIDNSNEEGPINAPHEGQANPIAIKMATHAVKTSIPRIENCKCSMQRMDFSRITTTITGWRE
jgi:hypothetical protein